MEFQSRGTLSNRYERGILQAARQCLARTNACPLEHCTFKAWSRSQCDLTVRLSHRAPRWRASAPTYQRISSLPHQAIPALLRLKSCIFSSPLQWCFRFVIDDLLRSGPMSTHTVPQLYRSTMV